VDLRDGRLHPVHAGGTIRFPVPTGSAREIHDAAAEAFGRGVDPSLLIRRIGLSANDVRDAESAVQLDLFTDYAARDRELRIQRAMLAIRGRYGRNAIVRGMNLLDGATAMERNRQIGGHKA
jgi:DNA polymerase V